MYKLDVDKIEAKKFDDRSGTEIEIAGIQVGWFSASVGNLELTLLTPQSAEALQAHGVKVKRIDNEFSQLYVLDVRA